MPNNPLPLVALFGDDLINVSTLTSGDDDPEFPITNAQSQNPAKLAKGVANTLTANITSPSGLPVAAAAIQTNAETITINGHSFVVPGLDSEGQRIHPWLSLTALIVTPGTSWTMVFSKASGVVFVGRIALPTVLYPLNVKYGWERGRIRPADIEVTTRGGSVINLPYAVRTKWAQGVVDLHEDESMLSEMDFEAWGKNYPMLLIPDEAVNESWFARQVTPYAKKYPNIDVRETALRFEELSCGPVNG